MIRTLRRTWNRLLGSLSFRRRTSDLAEELESHIQLLADENIRRGMPRDEAYRQARLKFGNVESTKESYRDQRGLPVLETTAPGSPLRLSRASARIRGFAAVAILSLAIGIGANTAIFSLVNGVLLQPLPYRDPDRLFAVREVWRSSSAAAIPGQPGARARMGTECPSLERVAVLRASRGQWRRQRSRRRCLARASTHNFFALFGVEPMLGRTFLPEEEQEGSDRVVILAESLWRSRFNADPSWSAKSIVIDGEDHQVVGIVRVPFWRSLASGRQDTASNARFELFRPLVLSSEELARMTGNYNYACAGPREARRRPPSRRSPRSTSSQARVPRPAGDGSAN